MKIAPKLAWMRPYLEVGCQFIPKGKNVTRLGYWPYGGRFGKREHAAIITNDNKNYRVYLKDMYQRKDMSRPSRLSKVDLLQYLAHELAHTLDWEHSPRHKVLEAQLTIIFMKMLDLEGYVSEEYEFENSP